MRDKYSPNYMDNYIQIQGHRSVPTSIQIPNGKLNIFVGHNNSGKSNLLIDINTHFGNSCDIVSPMRFVTTNEAQMVGDRDQFSQQRSASRKNKSDDTPEIAGPNPIQELACLDDKHRTLMCDWHNRYFGKLAVEFDPSNRLVSPTVTIDGRKPTVQGSGSRTVLAILVRLFDPKLLVVCIDEPELSVEPVTQKRLFELITRISKGDDELPSKQIYIATHSHLFLDRSDIGNNYLTRKEGNQTKFERCASQAQLDDLVFRLLGNSPADLFFPSNVIVVEGESDAIFLSEIVKRWPDGGRREGLRVHFAGGDSQVPTAAASIVQMLKSVAYTPVYKDKLCVLFDDGVEQQLIDDAKAFLGDHVSERVKQLSGHGIEYSYPKSCLAAISGIPESDLDASIASYLLNCDSAHDHNGKFGSFVGTKVELAKRVAQESWEVTTLDPVLREVVETAISKAFI